MEEKKSTAERGTYLYPDVYGKSVRDSIWYTSSPNVRHMIDHPEARERSELDALPPVWEAEPPAGTARPEGALP